jgi:hypothetical protein
MVEVILNIESDKSIDEDESEGSVSKSKLLTDRSNSFTFKIENQNLKTLKDIQNCDNTHNMRLVIPE